MSPSAPGPSGRPEAPGSPRPARPAGDAPLGHLDVTLIGSFPDPAVQLHPPLAEIAFAGRSNVGKSSLLNALTGRRRLARVSGTPGKTRHLNVFRVGGFYLLDLPGYGWARASKADRARFRQLIEACLTRRGRLTGVVWLLDIRHPPSNDDYAIQDLLIRTGRPCLAVLTKGDKLTPGRRAAAAKARAEELGLSPDDLLLTSARTGDGIRDLGESVLAAALGAG